MLPVPVLIDAYQKIGFSVSCRTAEMIVFGRKRDDLVMFHPIHNGEVDATHVFEDVAGFDANLAVELSIKIIDHLFALLENL